jgi:quinol monooxygenase YgiN
MATATMIVKHRVSDFDAWKKIFDELEALRRQHNWIGYEVLRDATDPNLVTIVNHIKDLAGAKAYGQSPDLRAAMQRAGMQGAPEIAFLNDSESLRY